MQEHLPPPGPQGKQQRGEGGIHGLRAAPGGDGRRDHRHQKRQHHLGGKPDAEENHQHRGQGQLGQGVEHHQPGLGNQGGFPAEPEQ